MPGDPLDVTTDTAITDTAVFTAPLQLAYPYDRTVGPTLSRFFTGLRDRRIEGTVGSDGRRYVPPAEFDPVTGVPCTDWVVAENTGTVQSWTWDPAAGTGWGLILLDGSDVPMLHRLLVGGPDEISTGMRVTARWSAERTGGIADIAGFVPEGTEQPDDDGTMSDEPITRVRLPMAMTYEWSAGPRSTSHLAGLQDGRLVGKRCDVCNLVYFPPRNGTCPRDGALLGDDVELPSTGTITTFCVVNVPFLGQAITPPYVAASILLDGADLAFQHLIQEISAEDVRMGMRVEAVWKPADEWGPTLENIRYFKPERAAMRDVAIVATAQRPGEAATTLTAVEMILPVVQEVLASAGVERGDIGFWCHGSCDYMVGQPFSFVAAVDALGAFPPIVESHVEADGAFALYEAWVKIQTGECDTALVFSNGKSSAGPIADILTFQLDPYVEAPLGPSMHVLAGLQARAGLDAGVFDERAMAEVAARSRRDAIANPLALVRGDHSVDDLLAAPTTYAPLREHDCPPVTDGANAVILAAGDVARSWSDRPAWIRGIDHRIDTQRLGARSLSESRSAAEAGRRAGVGADKVDVAELHAPYSHQELLLRAALGLDGDTIVNPSGGALCANPQMAAGLARFIEAAERVTAGSADRAVAHATSGPCLQQNLVAVLEGE